MALSNRVTSPAAFDTRAKMAQAVELRKQGYNFKQIGEIMGLSKPYVNKLVRKALIAIIQEPVQDLINLELERLDAILIPAYQAATKKDANGTLEFNKEAIEVVLKIMERRAKYLGMDKPVKSELKANLDVKKSTVQIYLPDNGRGLPVTIDNDTQLVDDESIALVQALNEALARGDTGEEDDLTDLEYDEDEDDED